MPVCETPQKHYGTRRSAAVTLVRLLVCSVVGLVPAACAPMRPPQNDGPPLYGPEKAGDIRRDGIQRGELTFVANSCPPAGVTHAIMDGSRKRARRSPLERLRMRYSPGDRFNLMVPGSADFTGDYVINADGRVILPFAGEIEAVGLTNTELAKRIEKALVGSHMFKSGEFQLSIRPVLYATINVTVRGAVFMSGRHAINGTRDAADKGEKALAKFGDSPTERFVAAALRAAGGIRPDADLSQVKLVRGGRTYVLDWRGAFLGHPVDDIALIEGDHIEVAEAPCFQSELVRPSQITPPGVRVFQSNLTSPTNSNANSAISQVSQSVPYGSRLLQGLVSSNCVGGSLASNASRYAVLITRNPKTHRTEVIQRSIEELVRSADRDTINPYLMPDDAIACYDSPITDMKEFANFAQTVMNAAQTGHIFRTW